jgi:hypothetical protein
MDPAWRAGIRVGLRLSLAHHPLCHVFEEDTVGRRVRVCSGCAAAAPAFLLGAVAVALLLRMGAAPLALVAAGLVMGLPQLSSYLWRGGPLHRFAVKALGGLGWGLVVVAGLAAPAPLAAKVFGLALVAVAFAALQGWRALKIVATCRACPWKMDWDACPGFNEPVAVQAREQETHLPQRNGSNWMT